MCDQSTGASSAPESIKQRQEHGAAVCEDAGKGLRREHEAYHMAMRQEALAKKAEAEKLWEEAAARKEAAAKEMLRDQAERQRQELQEEARRRHEAAVQRAQAVKEAAARAQKAAETKAAQDAAAAREAQKEEAVKKRAEQLRLAREEATARRREQQQELASEAEAAKKKRGADRGRREVEGWRREAQERIAREGEAREEWCALEADVRKQERNYAERMTAERARVEDGSSDVSDEDELQVRLEVVRRGHEDRVLEKQEASRVRMAAVNAAVQDLKSSQELRKSEAEIVSASQASGFISTTSCFLNVPCVTG